jgi:hypothetical protein
MTAEEVSFAELYGLNAEQVAWRRAKVSQLGSAAFFQQEYPLVAIRWRPFRAWLCSYQTLLACVPPFKVAGRRIYCRLSDRISFLLSSAVERVALE